MATSGLVSAAEISSGLHFCVERPQISSLGSERTALGPNWGRVTPGLGSSSSGRIGRVLRMEPTGTRKVPRGESVVGFLAPCSSIPFGSLKQTDLGGRMSSVISLTRLKKKKNPLIKLSIQPAIQTKTSFFPIICKPRPQ